MANEFKHIPLRSSDSIRLITLLPSLSFYSPVCCEIREVSLTESPEYEALSYVWGQPAPGHAIHINGDQTLEVTPNCLEALRYLRPRFSLSARGRVLWVDAICIDQKHSDDSIRERNGQVKIMDAIYFRAVKVVAWLGSGEASTSRVLRRVWLIHQLREVSRKSSIRALRSMANRMSKGLAGGMLKGPKNPGEYFDFDSTPSFRALLPILRHPWWFRVWTLQETALAKSCELHCGRYSILLDQFLVIKDYGFVKTFPPGVQVGVLFNWDLRNGRIRQSLDRGGLNKQSILRFLLFTSFTMNATLSLDKVYGLHGLLRRCGLEMEDPDYNQDTASVYASAVVAYLRTYRDLSILKLASRPHATSPDQTLEMPSWVPAWHLEHSQSAPGGLAGVVSTWARHDTREMTHWTPDPVCYSPGKLQLRGRSRGTVQYVALTTVSSAPGKQLRSRAECLRKISLHIHRTHQRHDSATYTQLLREMYYALANHAFVREPAPSGSSHDEQDLHAFCDLFDMLIYPDCRSSPVWFEELFAQFSAAAAAAAALGDMQPPHGAGTHWLEQEWSLSVVTMPPNFKFNKIDDEQLRRRMVAMTALWGKLLNLEGALGILDSGAIVATSAWAQPGDEVFLFPGADCPYVLRRVADGNVFRLVGPTSMYRDRDFTKWEFDQAEMVDVALI